MFKCPGNKKHLRIFFYYILYNMSDLNKVAISESLRKRIYRAKLKDQLGEEEFKKQQAQ